MDSYNLGCCRFVDVCLMSHCISTHIRTRHPPPCSPERLWLLFASSRAGFVFVSLVALLLLSLMPATCCCVLCEVSSVPARVFPEGAGEGAGETHVEGQDAGMGG